jgi:transcription-repair coupling factor (superfamily II helicase)
MSDIQSIFLPKVPHKIKQPIFWSGLQGCADSLAIATAIKNESRLFVVLTPDSQTALRLEHELSFFLQDEYSILHFPDWEVLPYDVFSPLPEIVSERLKALAKLPEVTLGALVLSVATLMHRLAPREHILANSFAINIGSQFNLDLNRIKLEAVGYQCVSQVVQHAEFAVRGAIVDLFPMGSKYPFRIELFDEEVESIRTFDPETQLSIEKVDGIQLFPAREFPFTDEAIKHFRQSFREEFPDNHQNNTLYQDVSKGITPSGIEAYLPLFVDKTESLFDYLPATTAFVLPETLEQATQHFIEEIDERFQQRKYDLERPLLAPEKLYIQADEFIQHIAQFRRIYLAAKTAEEAWQAESLSLPVVSIDQRLREPASRLKAFVANSDSKVLFVAETAGHREALIDKLRGYKISVKQVDNWGQFVQGNDSPCIVVASFLMHHR